MKKRKIKDYRREVETPEFMQEICTLLSTKDIPFEVLIRPPVSKITDLIEAKPSHELAVFTYQVETGLAEAIQENIKLCRGQVDIITEVKLVSYEGSEDYDKISSKLCDELCSLSKGKKLNLYHIRRSHIKLLIRDDTFFLGSQNFSTGSDSYPNIELLLKAERGGRELKSKIMSFMSDIDERFQLIPVHCFKADSLKNQIAYQRKRFREGNKRDSLPDQKKFLSKVNQKLIQKVMQKVMQVSLDDFHKSISQDVPQKLGTAIDTTGIDEKSEWKVLLDDYRETIEHNLASLLAEVKSKFQVELQEEFKKEFNEEFQAEILEDIYDRYFELVEDIHELLDGALEEHDGTLDGLVDYVDIYDKARLLAEQDLCDRGGSHPETGEYDPDGIFAGHLPGKIKTMEEFIEKENESILRTYFDEVSATIQSNAEQILLDFDTELEMDEA